MSRILKIHTSRNAAAVYGTHNDDPSELRIDLDSIDIRGMELVIEGEDSRSTEGVQSAVFDHKGVHVTTTLAHLASEKDVEATEATPAPNSIEAFLKETDAQVVDHLRYLTVEAFADLYGQSEERIAMLNGQIVELQRIQRYARITARRAVGEPVASAEPF
jgi:hypothetical protein